jgi:hypothetical protein
MLIFMLAAAMTIAMLMNNTFRAAEIQDKQLETETTPSLS